MLSGGGGPQSFNPSYGATSTFDPYSGIYHGPNNAGVLNMGPNWQQQMDKEKLAQSSRNAQLQFQAATYGPGLQQQRFGQVMPYFAQMLGSAASIGGQDTQAPNITVGGIWDDPMQQKMINLTNAGSTRSVKSTNKRDDEEFAGRGFGVNSPTEMAEDSARESANLGFQKANETTSRFNWAQGNAQHQLATETARSNQWAQQMQDDIERRKAQMQYRSSLAGAMAGMV